MKNSKEVDSKGVGMKGFFSEEEKARFENIEKRANDLGVWGISFANASASDAECYESVLDILEEDKNVIDANAGESDDQ